MPLSEVEVDEPAPLRLGRLDPDDHTILFGDGGAGKGVVSAWWAARLSQEGETILIVDYERHARFEWRPRVAAFGGDLTRVYIAQPDKAIWDIASDLAAAAEAIEATWLFVDSVGYACVGRRSSVNRGQSVIREADKRRTRGGGTPGSRWNLWLRGEDSNP